MSLSSQIPCQLDYINLSILDIEDSQDFSLVKHEFIGRDGALLVDMGSHPRTIKFKTYWYGALSDSNTRPLDDFVYSEHLNFLDLLSNETTHVFSHPKYGSLNVRVESFHVLHDDRQNYVEVEVVLVEDLITIKNGAVPASFGNAQAWDAALSVSEQMTSDIISSGFGNILESTFNINQPISSALGSAANNIRVFAASLDSNLNAFNALINDLTNPFGTITSSVNNIVSLPTLILNVFNGGLQKIQATLTPLSSSSYIGAAISSFQRIGQIFQGPSAPILSSVWADYSASNLISTFGPIVSTDTNLRQNVVSNLDNPSFDSAGNLINDIDITTSVMTQAQLAQSMNQLRTYVNIAIQLNPSDYQLRTGLRNLQSYINQIQFQLFTTKTITVSQQPIQSILMALGQSYKNAERILALNPQILDPNNVVGPITVYA